MCIGGSEFNVAMALARLQQSVMFTRWVANDLAGQLAIDLLRGAGVDISGIAGDPQAQTGWFIKEFYGLSDEPRVYYYRRHSAARDWMPPGLDELPTGKAVGRAHTGSITLMLDAALSQPVQEFVMQWAARDIPVSLHINYRQALDRPDEWRQAIRAIGKAISIMINCKRCCTTSAETGSESTEASMPPTCGCRPRNFLACKSEASRWHGWSPPASR